MAFARDGRFIVSHNVTANQFPIRTARMRTHGATDLTDTLDSYVCGTADAPLLGDTIGRCLDQAAATLGRSRGAGFAKP